MTEKLYVAARKDLDIDDELELFSSYGKSLSRTRDQLEGENLDVYELVKVSGGRGSVEQVSSYGGVWMVYADDGTFVFKTELEAYKYAFAEANVGEYIQVELKAYTEDH